MVAHKVLVPLDRSAVSRFILPQLRRFLEPTKNELILLHVARLETEHRFTPAPTQPAAEYWPAPAYPSHRDAEFTRHPIYDSQVQDSLVATLNNEFGQIVLDLQEAGYMVSFVVRFGDPARKILDFIEEEQIDLVAICTHRRMGPSRLIFGGITEKVLQHVSIPVFLAHPQEQPVDLKANNTTSMGAK